MPSTESKRLPSQKWCDEWQGAFDTSPDLEILETQRSGSSRFAVPTITPPPAPPPLPFPASDVGFRDEPSVTVAALPSEVAHSLLDLDEPRELCDIASRLSGQLEALSAETSTAADLRRELAAQRAALARAREQVAQELAMVHQRVQQAVDDAVLAARVNLEREREDMRDDRAALEADRAALEADREQFRRDRTGLNDLLGALVGTREELAQRARRDAATEAAERLQALREEHRAEFDDLLREHDRLRAKLSKTQQRLVKATDFMRRAAAADDGSRALVSTASPRSAPPAPPAPRASEAPAAGLDTPEARARVKAAARKGRAPVRGKKQKPERAAKEEKPVAPKRRSSLARRRF